MFAIEVSFSDGISRPEISYVRRPQALIGVGDHAHVVIDDMSDLDYQLRLIRKAGAKFSAVAVPNPNVREPHVPEALNRTYDHQAVLNLGRIQIVVTSLDIDLMLREGEAYDKAGARLLRQSCSRKRPVFPAVVVPSSKQMIVSFDSESPVIIGRSGGCGVRLDAADISSRHARIGAEGSGFWIEDLGSTNGTFVRGHQVSGRVSIDPGEPIILGRDVAIFLAVSEADIDQLEEAPAPAPARPVEERVKYPMLLSLSDVARPARVPVPVGGALRVGRDPASDMWLGAPHVSRRHLEVRFPEQVGIEIEDFSMNGVAHPGGILHRGEVLQINGKPTVLNFGSGITVAVCLSEDDEKTFVATQGAPLAFAAEAEMLEPKIKPPVQREASRSSITSSIFDTQQLKGVYRRLGLRGKLLTLFGLFLFGIILILAIRLVIPLVI